MLTIGTIALAMMTRVALGNTGRTLTTPHYMVLAFGGCHCAFIIASCYWATHSVAARCRAVDYGIFNILNSLFTYLGLPSC
nr:NnrS family protein [Pseudoalteromonas shioyasakiensis]